ncbi:hypothetical protein BK123_25705 [Paenibacillus lautus]|uniref:Uncharacterized protein n=1 Tax=Paenibacillus lautus TaxID=1401 RepID=A0A1R1AVY4_PAELA|nr:hypothetical protein BK123_25705 [Paenibacillus lautus]
MLYLVVYVVLFILNIPLYKWIFRRIFDNVDDLKQSVKYAFTPDIISLFRRRFWKDQWGELKLSVFLGSCFFIFAIECAIMTKILDVIFQ